VKREGIGWIQIEATFPRIGHVTNKEQNFLNSALTRPFHRILKEGKPTGTINYVFFGEHGFNPPVFVIGSLCLTERGRILFFPGVKDRITFPYYNGSQNVTDNLIMDHITFDSDCSCHATFANGKHLRLSSTIPPIDPNVYGWFSLSISKLSVLEILPKRFEVAINSPQRDRHRRMKDVIEARDSAKFHLFHLHDDNPTLNKSEFLHVDVYIELGNKRKMTNLLPSPPKGPPPLKESIKLKPPFPVRSHKVMIPTFNGTCHFLVTKHIGEVNGDAFFKGVGAP